MNHSYCEVYLHIVWATKNRQEMIKENIEDDIYKILKDKCNKFNVELIAIGNTQNHIHILLAFNPKVKISDIVAEFKGATSYFINHNSRECLHWQNGYGVLSVSKSGLELVKKYIKNQKENHKKRDKIIPILEKTNIN